MNTTQIIAEIGVNHECKMDKAYLMIDQLAEVGCDAAKFQSYSAAKISSKNSPAYWDMNEEKTSTQYELFKKYDQFNFTHFLKLKNYCDKKGIEFMSTPFDNDFVDILDPMVSRFKIASADITNIPLLEKIASTKKPLIMSTGASYIEEIINAKDILEKIGVNDITIMHCVLNYPCDINNSFLYKITDLKKHFPNNKIGFSDHTKPTEDFIVLRLAQSLGAELIETHYTFDKTLPGNDHYHSLDIADMDRLISLLKSDKEIIGENDDLSLQFKARKYARRGIYTNGFVKKGALLSEKNITTKRPVGNIPASEYKNIIGKKLNKSLEDDTSISYDDIS